MREQRGEKKLQRSVNLLCACVFAIYSFTFMAIYQSPLLEALYDKVATGKLNYNGYVVAATATTILLLLSWWMNKLARFQREWTAMAYLPASLLLAFITDIDRTIYTGESNYLSWTIILLTGFLLYALLAFLLQRILFAKIKNLKMEGNRIVWRNLMLFVLFFGLTGWLSNADEHLKQEATAYSRYKSGDIQGALSVASRSLSTSHEFTAARAFYLSQCQKLGDKLFTYPQYYRAEGLLPPMQQRTPLSPDTVYAAIGLKRTADETAVEYLYRTVQADSVSRLAADYFLCGLLLEKRLTDFVDNLPKYYNLEKDTLPQHYKEALMYYVTALSEVDLDARGDTLRANLTSLGLKGSGPEEALPTQYSGALKNFKISSGRLFALLSLETLGAEFARMIELERQYPDILVRYNYARKEFGHTYWWYYKYGE